MTAIAKRALAQSLEAVAKRSEEDPDMEVSMACVVGGEQGVLLCCILPDHVNMHLTWYACARRQPVQGPATGVKVCNWRVL